LIINESANDFAVQPSPFINAMGGEIGMSISMEDDDAFGEGEESSIY